ncbi:MAG: TatD family hydrolase [Candidatus Competibacterales bacterium]
MGSPPVLVDSHCHIDLEDFVADRPQVLARAVAAGVKIQVVPGVAAATWPALYEVTQGYPGLYPTFGLHPLEIANHRPEHLAVLPKVLQSRGGVAVGECGLDGYVAGLDWHQQWRVFRAQLAIARELGLPVIVHARRALDPVLKALRQHPGVRGVVHSFVGSQQQARQLVELGFFLGVGGPVTYPRAQKLRRVVAQAPLEALVLETDAPFQPLNGFQGQRNEPAQVAVVLTAVAELRQQSLETVATATTTNAKRLFALDFGEAKRSWTHEKRHSDE